MFEYVFMQRAFLAGCILGVAIPLIGVVVVFKRLSMMGDALSHTSLAGVAVGLIGGFDPVIGAAVACLGAAGAIEVIRRRFAGHAELAIALVMSCGIGLAGVLASFAPSAAGFQSYLFGSIVAVGDDEVLGVALVGALVIGSCVLFRKQFFALTLDERAARVSGINVRLMNGVFVVVCAFAVAVGSRTVGALIISSMMVVPVACALQVSRGWYQTCVASCLIGLAITAVGLVISYEFGLKPGGTIVLAGIALLLVLLFIKSIVRKFFLCISKESV